MKSTRLKDQGFINHYRKLVFRLITIGLVTYLFLVPNPVQIPEYGAFILQIIGVILMFLGIIGRMIATLSIGGKKDQLIIKTELYSVCRNPLYLSSSLMAAGLGMVSTRVDFLVLVILAFGVIFFPMMRNEARMLRQKFADYAEYEQRVPLFFPNFRLWQQRDEFQVNFPRVMRTLMDASLCLICLPVFMWLATSVQHTH